MDRISYGKDDVIRLYWIAESDKENYGKLISESDNLSNPYYTIEKMTDILWDSIIHGNDYTFAIFDNKNDFCGKISLHNPENNYPEIGIELLQEYRNRGIAKRAVQLLITEAQKKANKQYYLVRISIDNKHSRHVFEKMGAVLDNTEDSTYKNAITSLRAILKVTDEGETKRHLEEMLSEYEKKDKIIYEYKLFPETFE